MYGFLPKVRSGGRKVVTGRGSGKSGGVRICACVRGRVCPQGCSDSYFGSVCLGAEDDADFAAVDFLIVEAVVGDDFGA